MLDGLNGDSVPIGVSHPGARVRTNSDPVYFPFEGDATLLNILSKAFLLADEEKIKDSAINRQTVGR